MEPEELPDTREGVTVHFTVLHRVERDDRSVTVEEIDGYWTTGQYPDGRLGEIFLKVGKPGFSEAMYDQWAIQASKRIQSGQSLEKVFGKHVGQRFDPYGAVQGVKGIDRCVSILDLVSRWVLGRYGT